MQWTFLVLLGTLAFCWGSSLEKDEDVKEISLHSDSNHENSKILPVKIEYGKKKKNAGDVLRHLGMTRMKNPGNHHRKRLASQSRKSHSGDSHMYIVKLPPNPYYYDPEPAKGGASLKSHNVNRIPVDFHSNGKPGKIYHWNLPVVKKMVARKTSAKSNSENQIFKPSLWVGDEPHKKVSFYKPKKPAKQAFHKYFPGNGKPHSLYIIESKKSRPNSIHRIKE